MGKQKKKKVTSTSSVSLRKWSKKQSFDKYLKSLVSCDRFMDEKHIVWLSTIGYLRRRKIFARLKEVDPEGFDKLVRRRNSVMQKVNRERRIKKQDTNAVTNIAMEKDLVAMASNVPEEDHGVESFKYVQADTILEFVASLMASGYTKDEIEKRTSIARSLIDAVTSDHIRKMKRNIPEAIVEALDQKIYKDLVDTGSVTVEMERADRIVSRRRKLFVDAAKMIGQSSSPKPKFLDAEVIEEKQNSRFGVSSKNKKEEDA